MSEGFFSSPCCLCAKHRTWLDFFFMVKDSLSMHDSFSLFQKTKITYFPFCPCASEVAPYLQGSGRGQQVVLEGNRLVLTCLAGGSWPLQYRWTLNNSNITDWTPQYRSVSSDQLVICLTFCPSRVSITPFPPSFFSILSSESLLCSVMPVAWRNSCSIRELCPLVMEWV